MLKVLNIASTFVQNLESAVQICILKKIDKKKINIDRRPMLVAKG